MRRILFWLLVVVLLAAGAGAAWWYLRGDPRAELEALLGRTLGREVHIGRLEVDPRGHVTLHDVDIGNPEGFGGAGLLSATVLDLDVGLSDLLDGKFSGVVTAQAVELRLVKQGGNTNLAGLIRPRDADAGAPVDLHLDLAISGSRVLLEDLDHARTLVLEGVDVRVLLTNRDAQRTAAATVSIAEVALHGLPIRALTMTVRGDGQDVAIEALRGRIGARGEVTGSGRIFLAGERDWQFEIAATNVDLDADVRRVVAAVYPPLSSSLDATAATAATGWLGAELSLGGSGLHWEEIRPTLVGSGTARLHEVVLPRGSLLLALASLVGRADDPWTLGESTVVFAIGQGWIELTRVTAENAAASLPIAGRVSLVGELDLRVDLMPMVRLFGGGIYRDAARYATSLPVRIRGTIEHPEIAPPSVADLGKSLLGGAIRRSLGGSPP